MGKFPWGDKALHMPVFLGALCYTGCVMAYALTHMGRTGPAAALSLDNPGVRLCVLASLGWVVMMYNSMGLQVFLRIGAHNFSKEALGGAGRIVYNSVEHAPTFFVLMWLHCVFVDASQAGYLGCLYVCHRFLYGVVFSAMGQYTFLSMWCTQPGYTVMYYWLFSLLAACFPESCGPLATYLPTNPFVLAPVVFVTNLVLFYLLYGFPTGYLMVYLMNKANPFDPNTSAVDPTFGHLNEENTGDKKD